VITILAALIGFFSSSVPSILGLFQDKQDKDHELAVFDKQIELQKLGFAQQLQEIQLQTESAELQSMYSSMHTGITWVDALNQLVRPILALVYFGIFLLAKWPKIALLLVLQQNLGDISWDYLLKVIDMVWDDSDDAIFACIISFYFGSHIFNSWKKNNTQ
jgi:hypothetical protein